MKTTINQSEFIDAFRRYDRYDQFGYDALVSLFDYVEQLEDDCGEEMELDVIALCCDYSEDSVGAIADNYSIDLSDCDDDDERKDAVLEYLNDNTIVVGETDAGIVYKSF